MAALTKTVVNARRDDCHGIERIDTIEDQNRVGGLYTVADGQEEPECDEQRSGSETSWLGVGEFND